MRPAPTLALLAAGLLNACNGSVGAPAPAPDLDAGTPPAAEVPQPATDAGGATSTKKPNGGVGCKKATQAEDCVSGVCFEGNAQSFCTVACTTDTATTVCTAPLTGTCNKQGFCKRD